MEPNQKEDEGPTAGTPDAPAKPPVNEAEPDAKPSAPEPVAKPSAPEVVAKPSAPEPVAKPSAPEAVEPPADSQRQRKDLGPFGQFVSSGLFFMIVGICFLSVASYSMGYTHSSLSFVLVVLGVAILLYGTGTQGMGAFDQQVGDAKYHVALAGGAGVLAFCIGLGIVWKSDDIKKAFQIEKKYVRIRIAPAPDGISEVYFSNYVPDVSFNGDVVPAFRRGPFIEVYAHYFDTQRTGTMTVSLYYVEANRSPLVDPYKKVDYKDININFGTLKVYDGNLDFPVYDPGQSSDVKLLIDLRSEQGKKGKLPDFEVN